MTLPYDRWSRSRARNAGTVAACLLLIVTCIQPAMSRADSVKVAAAANVAPAIRRLAPLFEAATGHTLKTSFGSTGALYAQILNGAPYDLFLAADATTPQELVKQDLAAADHYFIYGCGRLVLWSASFGYVDERGEVLQGGAFERLAIANPKTAPYGAAAIQTLDRLQLTAQVAPKLITGENVSQTQQFVASKNVPLGFIALAQVLSLPEAQRGSRWLVPADHHQPIRQAAVLLRSGASRPAAIAFHDFLRSPDAQQELARLGYVVPPLDC